MQGEGCWEKPGDVLRGIPRLDPPEIPGDPWISGEGLGGTLGTPDSVGVGGDQWSAEQGWSEGGPGMV